jgi:nucleotide-binding universal stress UspA family protein
MSAMIQDQTRKIIVPIDFTVDSLQSLETANDIAANQKASLTLVYIIHPERIAASGRNKDYLMDPKQNLEEMKGSIDRVMDGIINRTIKKAIAVEKIIEFGNPVTEIAIIATRENADLILLPRNFFGSTQCSNGQNAKQKLEELSPCPVTLVS